MTPPQPSWIARWSTWAILTGVVVGGAGLAAWRFDVTQQRWNDENAKASPDFGTLRDLEDRGERWELAANLGFGVAAATAVTTLVLFLRDDGDAEPRVTVTPGPAAGLGVTARF